MSKNKKGFTIIEVVLVLAIAGLIFLMVFIALPALQRSQRNTQREDDLSRVLTAANDYQTNNNGKTPFNKASGTNGVDSRFVTRYIDETCEPDTAQSDSGTLSTYKCKDNGGDQFRDPDGNIYNMRGSKSASGGNVTIDGTWPNDHVFDAVTYASCGDEGVAAKGTGERQYAVFYILEGGAVSCNDNH